MGGCAMARGDVIVKVLAWLVLLLGGVTLVINALTQEHPDTYCSWADPFGPAVASKAISVATQNYFSDENTSSDDVLYPFTVEMMEHRVSYPPLGPVPLFEPEYIISSFVFEIGESRQPVTCWGSCRCENGDVLGEHWREWFDALPEEEQQRLRNELDQRLNEFDE